MCWGHQASHDLWGQQNYSLPRAPITHAMPLSLDNVNTALKATGNTAKLENIRPVYLSNKTWNEYNEYQLSGWVATTNGDSGYGLLAAYIYIGGPAAQASWLDPKVGGHLAPFLYSLLEPSELSQWLCYDDSTINIVMVIIIISSSIIPPQSLIYTVA